MIYILGLLVASGAMFLSIHHLGQSLFNYYDVVAASMVLGGTLSVLIIIMPWKLYRDMKMLLGHILFPKSLGSKKFIETCLEYIKTQGRSFTQKKSKHLAEQILADGAELITLDIKTKKIESILSLRIEQSYDRMIKVGNTIRGLAKYPPAFGLAGTVLGLVQIMHAVSAGVEPRETGLMMGIALVATMYGILVANLIVNPFGELVIKVADNQKRFARIALNAVLFAAEKTSVLESQEYLNSFVDEHSRVDVLQNASMIREKVSEVSA